MLPRDLSLLSLQQQKRDGDFVGKILHNGRSKSWAADLADLFERFDEDIVMRDAPPAVEKQLPKTQHALGPREAHESSPSVTQPEGEVRFTSLSKFKYIPPDANGVTGDIMATSPHIPHGKSSKSETPISVANMAPTTEFKAPALHVHTSTAALGSSSNQNNQECVRSTTIFSQASSHTLSNITVDAHSKFPNGLGSPTAQQPSASSSIPTVPVASRKRRIVISVSCDSESEFEPFLLPSLSPKSTNKAPVAQVPAARKCNGLNGVCFDKSTGKKENLYSFKPIVQKQRAGHSTPPYSNAREKVAPLTPPPAPKKLKFTNTPPTPESPTRPVHAAPRKPVKAPVRKAEQVGSQTALIGLGSLRTSERRTKLAAMNTIHKDANDDAGLDDKEEIRKAGEEGKLKTFSFTAPTPSQLDRGMHGTGFTLKSTLRSYEDEDDDQGEKEDGKPNVNSSAKRSQNRLNGD